MHQGTFGVKASVVMLLFAWCIYPSMHVAGVSQQGDLKYQDRGDRYEGIKGTPVSDRVDLISALVDYRELLTELPTQFKLKFYVRDRTPIFITVREIDNRRNYWLDRVRPILDWRAGTVYQFRWTTAEVIKPLNIQLYELGAVVQLDDDEPSMDMRVAPSILYHSSSPSIARDYQFTFKIGRRADVTCSFSKDEANSPIISRQAFEMSGQRPRTVSWNASNAREGWYRLRINVVYSNNGQEVNKVVRFYHRPNMGDASEEFSEPDAVPTRNIPQASSGSASGNASNSENTFGVFPYPVKLTERQREFLSSSAETVNRHEKSLKTNLARLEPKASFNELKKLLLDTLTEARREVELNQESFTYRFIPARFTRSFIEEPDLEAARMFFGEILARYDRELETIKKSGQGDYAAIRDRTLQLLSINYQAYGIVTRSGDFTFNLEIASVPQGASISYKRKGDADYTSDGSQTKTILQNLGYAVWFVRAGLPGYKEQEKAHDPFRESNHILTFELEQLPKATPAVQEVKKSNTESQATPRTSPSGRRKRLRSSHP